MAPFWAAAHAAAATTKNKRTALAVHPELTALRNKGDAFKVSSKRTITPLHTIEPGSFQKVVSHGSRKRSASGSSHLRAMSVTNRQQITGSEDISGRLVELDIGMLGGQGDGSFAGIGGLHILHLDAIFRNV